MPGSILGERVIRKEDPKFLTTGGKYLDDLNDVPELAGAAHVVYVRSAVAHGTITSIDTSEAAGDARRARRLHGRRPRPRAGRRRRSTRPSPAPSSPATGSATSASRSPPSSPRPAAQATDAAEAVVVDYDVLDAVVDPEEALTSSTHLYEAAGGNAVFDSTALGAPDLTGDEFFADCEVTASGRFVNQRVAPCPLEVRGSAAAWIDGRLHQWVSTQHAQGIKGVYRRQQQARGRPGPRHHARRRRRLRRQDRHATPRRSLLGELSKRARPAGALDRDAQRVDDGASATAGPRSRTSRSAARRDGKVTHYRLHVIQDSGAFADMGAILAPFMTRPMSSGVYAIPNIECRTTSVVTNTTPTVAYRGAGRPEATAAIERAMDLFAAEIGMDPADVRRINLIPPFTEPHTTVDRPDLRRRRLRRLARPRARGRRLRPSCAPSRQRRRESGDTVQLGIGVSIYVEITGGVGNGENAKIEVHDDGTATIYTGTSPHGQGHDTAWSMIASAQTGIPIDKFTLVWGDTDLTPVGDGTMGSRSLQQGGAAVDKAAIELVEAAKPLAAQALEAAEADIELDLDVGHVPRRRHAGRVEVVGRPRRAGHAATASPLTIDTRFDAPGATFPFGAHVAVVEVDTETGQVTPVAASSPATTPARSSTRCCSTASATAASPRAPPRR